MPFLITAINYVSSRVYQIKIRNVKLLCPVCGSSLNRIITFTKDKLASNKPLNANYFWVLCNQCGTAFPSEKISPKEQLYYWSTNRIENNKICITEKIWERRWSDAHLWAKFSYEFISPWIKPGMQKFLDIGCGLGATMAEFQRHGWEVEGVDPDPNVLPFHEKLRLKTRICSFEEARFSRSFDVISSAHAIYFAEDPAGFVVKAGSLLSPGGLFVVLSTQLLSWRNHNRPSYLTSWFPTPESLQLLFHLNGFRLLDFQSKKGSDFFLFEKGAGPRPSCHPRRAWLLHWTHRLRYVILGWPLSLLKRLIGK